MSDIRSWISESSAAVSSKRGLWTIVLVGIGAIVFYSLEWRVCRLLIIDVLVAPLSRCGYTTHVVGYELQVNGVPFAITRDCTYMEWVLYAFPLLWRPGRIQTNMSCILAVVAGIWGLNLLRIWFSIIWNVAGVSWFWAHDFFDYWAWYGTLTVVVVGWLEWMRQEASTNGRM